MKKTIMSGLTALSLMALTSYASAGTEINDVVHDFQGNIVKNSFHNCVVTKWQSGEYNCGEQQESVEAVKDVEFNTEMLNVYFNFNSAELSASSRDKLDKVVELLNSAKKVENIDIVGYADYLGNSDYNRKLSDRRAEAVRHYLQSRGYSKTRNVSVEALGESRPVTNCGSLSDGQLKDCLWRDRRVEIKLNYAK